LRHHKNKLLCWTEKIIVGAVLGIIDLEKMKEEGTKQIQSNSAQNIKLVQGLYQAFAKKDIPAILASLSPDVEWGEPENPLNPSGGTKQGHKGFLEWLRIGKESEEILSLEPRHFLTGENIVALVGCTKCLAKPTGKTYETDFVHLAIIKDGKII
jgi:uncharacterized protein